MIVAVGMLIFVFFYDRSQLHIGTVLYQIVYAPEKKRVPGYMKRAVLQENK